MRPLCLAALPILASLAVADAASAESPNKQPLPPPPPAAAATTSITAANDFNFAMYGALKGKSGNLFFSAPSLREALGIAYLGAKGTTATEMSSAIRLDTDAKTSSTQAKSEIADFNAAKGAGATLSIANRLWADQGFTMKDDFKTNAVNAYGSPVDPVDFSLHPNDSRLAINKWVATKTNDKITDLIPAGAISPDTRLVITNAIWFKGTWAQAFTKSATNEQPFLVEANGTKTNVNVPMMHQTSHFAIASIDGAKILEMPYDKSDLAMDVILPDATGAAALTALEDKLVGGNRFATWTSALHQTKVDVSMPKLTFTWGGSVKDDLKGLGMKTAFMEGDANFTGIASARAAGGNLFVSDVIHKAFVAIDEQGTEAAASTAVIIARESRSIEQPPTVFKADHPFLFVIRDVKHGRILFMGRVNNPK